MTNLVEMCNIGIVHIYEMLIEWNQLYIIIKTYHPYSLFYSSMSTNLHMQKNFYVTQ